ncbi:hypothetical protein EMCRGX_G025153 [Ephydatia muelleri]|eukprot:Em0021g20a
MSANSVTIQKLREIALTTTKTELHEKLVELDRGYIRKRVYIRSALACTEPLQEIRKQLNQHTNPSKSQIEVSLERLSVHSDAFDGVIKVSGVYSRLLERIKESYDKYVLLQLKHEQSDSRIQLAATPEQPITESVTLRKLKSRVSKLETHFKLTVEESARLKSLLLNEKLTHTNTMESFATIPPDEQNEVLPSSYGAKVENLQLQIANEQGALQEVMARRLGKVPISVCYQLEQCVREVELEIQKLQKRCEALEVMVQDAESTLVTMVTAAYVAPEISSKLWQGLQESVSSEM